MKKEQKSGVLEMEKRIRKKLKNTNFIPWEEKKELIDKEEIQLHKGLDQLTNWVSFFILFSIPFDFDVCFSLNTKLCDFEDKNGGFHEWWEAQRLSSTSTKWIQDSQNPEV